MYELRLSSRYLFQPKASPPVLAGLVICLVEATSGLLLLEAHRLGGWPAALAAMPPGLLLASTFLPIRWRARRLVRRLALLAVTLHLLEMVALAPPLRGVRLVRALPALLPALFTLGVLVWSAVRRRRAPGLLVAGIGASLVGLLLVGANERLAGAPPSYAGALFVVAGAFGAATFFFLTFLSAFTTISVAGVVLGAASLVTVRSVTRGFVREFQDKVLGFNAHVLVMKDYYGFANYREVAKTIRHLPHVTGAAPFTIAEMIVTAGKRHTTALTKGIDPERVQEVLDLPHYLQVESPSDVRGILEAMGRNLDKGTVLPGRPDPCLEYDEDGDPIPGSRKNCPLPGIVIGTGLAKRLQVRVGDVLRLISPTAELQGYREQSPDTPLARDFRVVGTFYCGFEEYDDKLVFVHLGAVQNFVAPPDETGADNSVLGIEVKLDDIYAAGQVAKLIQDRLEDEDIRVVTWYSLNRPLFEALQSQRTIMTLFVFITVIVAAFGILAALTMMVLTKTKEIAILKAMGATAAGISRVFQFAGVMVGMLGVLVGSLLGLTSCHVLSRVHFPLDPKIYLISYLPVLVDPREIALVMVAGLLLCFLSTIYPARKAAAYRPVEGLRHE